MAVTPRGLGPSGPSSPRVPGTQPGTHATDPLGPPAPTILTPHDARATIPLAAGLARVAPAASARAPAVLVDARRTALAARDLAARTPADALPAHLAAFERSAGVPARGVTLERFLTEAARGHFGLAADRPTTYAAFRAHLRAEGLGAEHDRIVGGLDRELRARLFAGQATPVELFAAAAEARASWRALQVPAPYAEVLRAARLDGSIDDLRATVEALPTRARRAVESGRVAPAELALRVEEARLRTSDVLVIGAGMAGLAAAQELLGQGLRVTVLEARDRVGGRTHTDDDALGSPFDHGAAWLHGAADNPLTAITKQLGFATQADDAPHLAYGAGDPEVAGAALHHAMEQTRDAWSHFAETQGDRPLSEAPIAPGPWGEAARAAMAQGSLAVHPSQASAADWNGIHPEIGDELVPAGLGTVVASFAHGVPVKLDTAVTKIEWGDEGVTVTANGQRYHAEKLIITVPTGVLAAGKIEFDPPLPGWKKEAIEKLPMGQFDKVALSFAPGALPDVPAASHVGALDADAPVGTLPMELVLRPFDSDTVVGFVGGDVAEALAQKGREAAVDVAVDRLAKLYGDQVRDKVLRSFVTSWGSDPWAMGAYSAALPGFAHMRERLAQPVDDTLFFAGEAAHVEWAQCVPGAYLTGVEAAQAIADKLSAAKQRAA